MTTLDREIIDTPAPTAVLDSAHVGDIEGALGRIRLSDNDRPRTLNTRPATLLAIIGPGLIVLLLCNDRELLGPWVSRPWLNVVAGTIVGGLLLLSGILMATTMFPALDIVSVAVGLVITSAVCAGATFAALWWRGRHRLSPPALELISGAWARADQDSRRMPPLALLEPVTWSLGIRVGMLALRGYLVIEAILLVVKAVQLGSA